MTVEQIKPFAQPDRDYTRLHNVLFDVVMPTMKPNAWKMLCFILRKTNGWNKTEAQLSYNQLRAGTGIQSDATLSATIKELADARYIIVTPIQWQSSLYELNYQYIVTTSQPTTKDEPAQPTSKTVPTTETKDTTEIEGTSEIVVEPTTEIEVPPTTEIEDIKRKVFKEKEKERECAQAATPQPVQTPPPALSADEYLPGILDPRKRNGRVTGVPENVMEAKKLGLDAEQFRLLVDSLLDGFGQKPLADAGDDRVISHAQLVALRIMGISEKFRTPEGIASIFASWKENDFRGDTLPTSDQFKEHASLMASNKVTCNRKDKKSSKPFAGNNGQAQPSQLRKMTILT
ncbi:MAG: hypothetical protein E6Q97_10265 [Desulfurellales bacterium]|nr:MAG: hypothetical protein E6Q97_10265 [Desulfurellales bacterium]